MILDDIIKEKKKTLEQDILETMHIEKGKIAQCMKQKDIYVIGEIKKASPSKGVLVEDFCPTTLAKHYMKAGIDAISIVTEKNFFQGDLQYVRDVKRVVDVPLLRKDFIIDIHEIIQAKRAGASLILLIVALLDDQKLREFYHVAYALGMECIVEVHSEIEVRRALKLSPQIIGINNRDLTTFDTDLATSKRLRPLIPKDIAVVSESGITTSKDIKYLREVRIDGVLIGESFMRCEDISAHLKELLCDE